MTTALPVDEPGARAVPWKFRPDHVVRMAVAGLAVAIGWLGGILVFGLISVRYGYWLGLGLTGEEIAARAVPQKPES